MKYNLNFDKEELLKIEQVCRELGMLLEQRTINAAKAGELLDSLYKEILEMASLLKATPNVPEHAINSATLLDLLLEDELSNSSEDIITSFSASAKDLNKLNQSSAYALLEKLTVYLIIIERNMPSLYKSFLAKVNKEHIELLGVIEDSYILAAIISKKEVLLLKELRKELLKNFSLMISNKSLLRSKNSSYSCLSEHAKAWINLRLNISSGKLAEILNNRTLNLKLKQQKESVLSILSKYFVSLINYLKRSPEVKSSKTDILKQLNELLSSKGNFSPYTGEEFSAKYKVPYAGEKEQKNYLQKNKVENKERASKVKKTTRAKK